MIENEKKLLRRELLAKRRSTDGEEKKKSDCLIADKFLACEAYKKCKTLLVYCSTPIEVDTFSTINAALKDGKSVAAPVCTDSDGTMDFYLFTDVSQLVPSRFDILAPIASGDTLVNDFTDALCVVPALAFDMTGNRLGYGKGYYDRFLARTDVLSVGLCYDDFIFENLPKGEYDRCVDYLVSEKSVIKF